MIFSSPLPIRLRSLPNLLSRARAVQGGLRARTHSRSRARRNSILCLGSAAFSAVLFVSFASAATIVSTPVGGPWHLGSTWVGGIAPLPGDDVILEGPVGVQGSTGCASLLVAPGGRLGNGAVTPTTLEVAGGITNAGTIENGQQIFYVRVGGDLDNDGIWTNWRTICTGTTDQHLSQSATGIFECELVRDGSATGDLVVETPFAIRGNFDFLGGRVILGPDGSITLRLGFFSGEIFCGGNEVRFEAGSYLFRGVMDAGVLVGTARASSAFSFTGGLTIMDALTHSIGGAHLLVEGTLVNHGVIHNETYGLTITLSGDLECYGTIMNSFIEMDGSVERHLRMGPDGNLDANVLLPEFGAGSLVVDSDGRISEGISLGQNGSMTLLPGTSLRLTGGSILGGTLWAGGSDIYLDSAGTLGLNQADQVILHGVAQASDGTVFTGGLQVVGALQNPEFADSEIWVEGDLLVDGELRDHVRTLSVHATGNLINHGSISNSRLIVDGTSDQVVEIGAGIDTPEFILRAGFVAGSYQWFRDEVPLAGEILDQLVFATVDAGDSGTYRCEGGEGQVSRAIVLGEGLITGTPDPDDGTGSAPGTVPSLAAVWPNPVRIGMGSAEIAFDLPEAGEVRLALFDASGREVALVYSGHLDVGSHVVPFEPRGVATGVYFLRIGSGAGAAVRKVALVE